MPIRFRCPYCNQLLGIARRKAGTRVGCPTCHAQVTVPGPPQGAIAAAPEPAPAAAPALAPAAAPAVSVPLFEHGDFDELLRRPGPPPAPAAPPAAAESPMAFDVERVDHPALPSRPGLFLSPTQATVLTAAAIALVALAFGAGLLVGRFLL
jgi:hypothetical protein